jgi:subtilisin family serine protease
MISRGRRPIRSRSRWASAGAAASALVTGLALGLVGAVPASAAQFQSLQWGLSVIGAPTAWQYGTGAGVRIGIVDTGVDVSQQDLQGKVVAQHYSVSDPSSGCEQSAPAQNPAMDDNGHGTHVAGIAAASGQFGVTGVAPSASLVVAKVLDCSGSGEYNDVVAGIDWAVQQGAKVINLSLGDESIGGLVDTSNIEGSPLGQALQSAWNSGAIPVIAAGNNSNGLLGLGDANYAGVPAVVVAATGSPGNGETDEVASYSNGVSRAQWGVAAPGGDDPNGPSTPACVTYNPGNNTVTGADAYEILSTYWWGPPTDSGSPNPASCYATDEGTSMATPFVTGTLALLLGRGLSQSQAVQTLLTTANRSVSCGSDCSGLIDAGAAMEAAAAATAPASAGSSPPAGSSQPGARSSPHGSSPGSTAGGATSSSGSTTTSSSTTGSPTTTANSGPPSSALHAAAAGGHGHGGSTGGSSAWWVVLAIAVGLAAAGALGLVGRRRWMLSHATEQGAGPSGAVAGGSWPGDYPPPST